MNVNEVYKYILGHAYESNLYCYIITNIDENNIWLKSLKDNSIKFTVFKHNFNERYELDQKLTNEYTIKSILK